MKNKHLIYGGLAGLGLLLLWPKGPLYAVINRNLPPPSPKPVGPGGVSGLSHSQASSIVHQAWVKVHGREPTESERNYAQAIALLETGYGRIGQFAQMAARGKYNWGAIQARPNADGSCPVNYEPGIDQGNVCFRVFPSDIDAAAEFIKQLTLPYGPATFQQRRQGTLNAMNGGSPEDVARAMRTPTSVAYYAGPAGTEEQKVAYYANAIRSNLNRISPGLV